MYDFGKEMYFDVNATGTKFTRDRTFMKLKKSPGILASVSGASKKSFSKTKFFSTDPNEL